MAVEVGMYNIGYPGARSRLAHARLLIASQQSEDVVCESCSKLGNNPNMEDSSMIVE